MENRELRVSQGVTLNAGNYQTVRIDYSETAIVRPGEDIDAARDTLYQRVDDFMSEKIAEARKEIDQL